jgi:Zn-dependent peptidase ImmA (M78 family)
VSRVARYDTAALAAERVLLERGITTLPVDPIAIAEDVHILVQAKPVSVKGASGMLLRSGDLFAIAFATHIKSEGFQRFSIAHELGHYFLPGHVDAVLGDSGVHESHAGFQSDDPYEIEADHFASGLLMPRKAFTEALRSAGEGLIAIEKLAKQCATSLSATALRYVQCATDPVAIIVATGRRIDYCFMSEALREVEGLDWLKKGEPLPAGTNTFKLATNPDRVVGRDRHEGSTDLQDWFGGSRSLEVAEDVIGLGSYGKTLTVLYGIEIPDDEDQEEALEESWTPRFRR